MKFLLSVLCLAILSPGLLGITLGWDANPPGDNVVKYNVYEVIGPDKVLVGSSTTTTFVLPVSPVVTARTYVLTACNSMFESLPSAPLTIPAAPLPPMNLRILKP